MVVGPVCQGDAAAADGALRESAFGGPADAQVSIAMTASVANDPFASFRGNVVIWRGPLGLQVLPFEKVVVPGSIRTHGCAELVQM